MTFRTGFRYFLDKSPFNRGRFWSQQFHQSFYQLPSLRLPARSDDDCRRVIELKRKICKKSLWVRCVADGWGSLKGSQRLRKVIKKPFLLTTARPYDSFPNTCRRRRFVLILIWFILHTHEPSIQTDRADRGQVEDLGRILLNGSARDIVPRYWWTLLFFPLFTPLPSPCNDWLKLSKSILTWRISLRRH